MNLVMKKLFTIITSKFTNKMFLFLLLLKPVWSVFCCFRTRTEIVGAYSSTQTSDAVEGVVTDLILVATYRILLKHSPEHYILY